jgi:hypothetical protein
MNRGLNLTHNDKIVIMQPYPSVAPSTAAGQQQVDFFLGTYLLLKGDQTYLNIDHGGGVQYYPEYQLDLGTPTAPPPSDVASYLWNGVYRRDFQNGLVLVNPGSTTYSPSLGGSYQEVQGHGGGTMTDAQLDAHGNYTGGSLTYQTVSSVMLAGGSAAIFLNPSGHGALTVATPAQAAANPVAGTSTGLSVLGQENGSDGGLRYTWSSSGPAGVTFSANGTNSAKNTAATFVQAGSYTMTATISDAGQSVRSSVTVTVDQTLTRIQVSPGTARVPKGATQQFSASALDQFGAPMATQPAFTWSLDDGGLGTIDPNGLYHAPATGVGSGTVRARSGPISASAAVRVLAGGTVDQTSPSISIPTPSVPPVILAEQALFARKLNKKHEPFGKPTLTGFRLDFSTTMNPATAGNAGNYQVDWISTRRVKKKVVQILHPVPFHVQYDATSDSVSLLLSGKQAFARGGRITVIAAPPNGISSSTGVLLDGGDTGQAGDNGVFTILPKARGITRG